MYNCFEDHRGQSIGFLLPLDSVFLVHPLVRGSRVWSKTDGLEVVDRQT